MHLTPVEKDRLWLFLAAELARKRRGAGLKLNHPEAVALICDELIESARAGNSYDEVRTLGYEILSEEEVMDGVPEMIDRLQVEPMFEDGSQLITLYFPVGTPVSSAEDSGVTGTSIGSTASVDTEIEGNVGARTVEVSVSNTSDRAIQVTSHYHFFETNRRLIFDREAAFGMRLDVPAGTSVRFEPGETRTVRLREVGGRRVVRGFHNLVNGSIDDPAVKSAAMARARTRGFIAQGEAE